MPAFEVLELNGLAPKYFNRLYEMKYGQTGFHIMTIPFFHY